MARPSNDRPLTGLQRLLADGRCLHRRDITDNRGARLPEVEPSRYQSPSPGKPIDQLVQVVSHCPVLVYIRRLICWFNESKDTCQHPLGPEPQSMRPNGPKSPPFNTAECFLAQAGLDESAAAFAAHVKRNPLPKMHVRHRPSPSGHESSAPPPPHMAVDARLHQRTDIPDLLVYIRAAMFIEASSWKSSFAAYGICTCEILFLFWHARHSNVFFLSLLQFRQRIFNLVHFQHADLRDGCH